MSQKSVQQEFNMFYLYTIVSHPIITLQALPVGTLNRLACTEKKSSPQALGSFCPLPGAGPSCMCKLGLITQPLQPHPPLRCL